MFPFWVDLNTKEAALSQIAITCVHEILDENIKRTYIDVIGSKQIN